MKKESTYTCIFGGGAIRGVAYVGAIKALDELNIKYDTLAGSSVGSIIATLVAIEYSYDEIKEIIMGVNFELFRDFHLGFGKDFALSKGEVFTNWMREKIEKKFYGENYKKGANKPVTFEDLDKSLLIFSTDLIDFKCKEFSKQETPDFEIAKAVRISCSMPGLMTSIEVDGKKLVDGDLLKSTPLWTLSKNLKMDTNRIMEFRLEGNYETVENNALDFINAIYSCMTSVSTDFIIKTYGNRDNFDYIKLNTGNVIILDFNMSETMRNQIIDTGYKQSMNYLTNYLPNKKENLVEKYDKILKPLEKLFPFIKSNNVKTSKVLLGEIFIELIETKDLINKKIFEDILSFKDEFLNSSGGRTWFGNSKFDNQTELLKHLSNIIFKIDSTIYELKNSIKNLKKISCQL